MPRVKEELFKVTHYAVVLTLAKNARVAQSAKKKCPPAVSKMERRTDMYVSTLHDLVKAIGGQLRITATFPEAGTIEIRQFHQSRNASVKKAQAEVVA